VPDQPLEPLETAKDTVQVAIESAFHHVGAIAGIITSAGRDVTREIGDWASDVFEMREAARSARAAAGRDEDAPEPGGAGDELG
jgi:hypothetical protein